MSVLYNLVGMCLDQYHKFVSDQYNTIWLFPENMSAVLYV